MNPITPARRGHLMLMICSMAALIISLTLRVLGPSDLWDNTQPKTVSYTTDILVHGGNHWILPVDYALEHGAEPATKPPLYNWIAAPLVSALGFNSEIAHRSPSILAFVLCWLCVVRVGRNIDPDPRGSLGWL